MSGEAAFQTIQGIQSQGVQAKYVLTSRYRRCKLRTACDSAKHYILNEQEHMRDSASSNADDRTLHEIYLAPVR